MPPRKLTEVQKLHRQLAELASDALKGLDLRDARIKELENSIPTPEAYAAACMALTHWRAEARRLAKSAGVKPREMKLSREEKHCLAVMKGLS